MVCRVAKAVVNVWLDLLFGKPDFDLDSYVSTTTPYDRTTLEA
jgi:hypothetical protein